MKLRTLAGLVALSALACQDPVDKAAKARIFSAEDPPKFVTRAADNLAPDHLEQSAENIRRVFTMTALEAGERLGPHAQTAKLRFTWTLGPKTIALDESRDLTLGAKGDFAAKLDAGDELGESKQGMEILRAQGKVYARSRFQKFRARDRDRGAAEAYEERIHDALSTLYGLFDGRIALSPQGTATVAGRSAVKYAVVLAEKPPVLEKQGPALPPAVPPRTGVDPHLARELDLQGKKDPRSLTGTLVVDAETAVPLEANLTGTLEAPGDGAGKASLKLEVELETSKVDKGITLTAPKDALPDEGRPQSIAAALARFDLPRARTADAGAGSQADEPDEEK